MSVNLEDIRKRALSIPRRVALVDGEDERVIDASIYLHRHGKIEPILLGDRETIQSRIRHKDDGIELSVVDPRESALLEEFTERYRQQMHEKGRPIDKDLAETRIQDRSYFAAMLLESGKVDGMVGGSALPTAHVLRAALETVGLADGSGIVSGSFAMFLPNPLPSGQNVLLFADCAVVPEPNSEQMASIAANAVRVTDRVLGMEPIVAFLSFSTKGSAEHPLVDKTAKAVELSKERMPEVAIDGELQVDTALIPEVAERKMPESELRGQSNILIFPDLNSGNIAYKLVERLARAEALGVILEGFSKPVNDLSRGCSVQSVIDMACVTALQVKLDPSMEDAAVSRGSKNVEI